MTLTFTGRLDRGAVTRAAALVQELVARPGVVAGWTSESSCAGLTVGGLTRHLVEQSRYVVGLLGPAAPTPPPGTETISVLEHYARSDWLGAELDAESNLFVRDKSETQASEGAEAAIALQTAAVDAIPAVLASAPEEMFLPWSGAMLATDDFLVTRLMEIVVHADDLASSVGEPAPEFGPAVLEPVLGLLTTLAVVRHGQSAVVRTLARPQRAPTSISAL